MKDKQTNKRQTEKHTAKGKKTDKELSQQIELLQREKDEVFAKLQRLSADYTNFQKRIPRQIADSVAYEKENIIKSLLPALDNFEHTLQNAHSTENVNVLVKGIRIIYDQMLDILRCYGVEQVQALGEEFDPAVHQAVIRKNEPDQNENVVLEEFQKGYKLNGRIIRPSKVVVNKRPTEQIAKGESDQPTTPEKADSSQRNEESSPKNQPNNNESTDAE